MYFDVFWCEFIDLVGFFWLLLWLSIHIKKQECIKGMSPLFILQKEK